MKKSGYKLRRVLEAFRKGYSIAHIARTEKLSRPTVTRWLADAGVDTTAPRDER